MKPHTDKPSLRTDKCISIVFIGVIVVCGAFSWSGLRIDQTSFTAKNIFNGSAAQSLESHYDQRFALKQLGTNSWGALEYTLFGEGRQGVVVGNGGWLFSNEEFYAQDAQNHLQQNLAYIGWVAEKLATAQVQLLVVPVPAKSRLYAEYLGNQQPNNAYRELYSSLTRSLREANIHSLNTLALMEQQKNHNTPLFLRTDTHWSPEGAQLVARAVAYQLSDLELPSSDFTTEKVAEKNHRGDLTRFLPLSPWFDQLMPQADTLNVYRTYAAEDALFEEDALFGDEDHSPAVALVGTSYSADPQWNFEGALKQHLNTELSNFAQSAQGPLAPMNTFLEQQLNNLPELQVVIWEIPERYLLVGYPELYPEAHSNISGKTVAVNQ
ncbi:alginate O-acetyltransferase [bacterium SCSIO 12696]|nr:alginate O-acetyltransferase [bacterium SCSIO 12696]